MGILTSWLGKLGPFYHNSEETYPDGSAMRSGRFEGPVRIDGAPSADTDAVRLLELNAAKSALVRPVAVADIDDPSMELAAYAGSRALPYLSAYEAVDGGDDKVTLYVWKEDYASGASAPYVVAGTGGFWVAIGGEYSLAGTMKAVTSLINGNEQSASFSANTAAGLSATVYLEELFNIQASKSYMLTVSIARRGATASAAFKMTILVLVSAALKTVRISATAEDSYSAKNSYGDNCAIALDGMTGVSGSIPLSITGAAGETMAWNGSVKIIEV